MNILKELYNGNVAEIIRRRNKMKSTTTEKQDKLYEQIRETLSREDMSLVNDYIDAVVEVYDEEFEDKYIQGLKTGLLIGIEVCNLEL